MEGVQAAGVDLDKCALESKSHVFLLFLKTYRLTDLHPLNHSLSNISFYQRANRKHLGSTRSLEDS